MTAKRVAGAYLGIVLAFGLVKAVEISGWMPVLYVVGIVALVISIMVAVLVLGEDL